MKTCLVTAFEPFGTQSINASLEAMQLLPKQIGPYQLIKIVLPVVFDEAFDVLLPHMHAQNPDLIIMLGEAGGRKEVQIERVAINIDHARIPDNKGHQPYEQRIIDDGPAAYFTRLPYIDLIHQLKKEGLKISVSDSAGTYLCNHIMYQVLHHIEQKNIDEQPFAGFIHVPYVQEQVEQDHMPFMTKAEIASIIEHIIKHI